MAMRIDQISAPRYTVDEIESWPDDGNRYEVLDGVLLVTPAPGPPHQLVATEIAHLLAGLLEPWPSLRVAAPGVIVLRPKTQLIPDVLVFEPPRGRFRWEEVRRRLLAVEVMSPSTWIYDRDYKRPAYLALGVAESWRVDPDEQVVYVSRPGEPPDQPCRQEVGWTPPGLGATLTLPLERVFRDT